MKIYCADVRGVPEDRAARRGESARPGSAFAWSLLERAAAEQWGLSALPRPARDAKGKPCFPQAPGLCFSLSHTEGFVLAALSSSPVGADIQALREPPPRLLATATEEELRLLGFFGLWTLRESVYKLSGEGSLRSMRFSVRDGEIAAPVPGMVCRLYGEVPGCMAAAASLGEELPESVIFVPASDICT